MIERSPAPCQVCGRQVLSSEENVPTEGNVFLHCWLNALGLKGVFLSEIHAFTSDKKGVVIMHTAHEGVTLRTNKLVMNELETLQGWVRVHNSVLVRRSSIVGRRRYLDKSKQSVVVDLGTRVVEFRVSRRRAPALRGTEFIPVSVSNPTPRNLQRPLSVSCYPAYRGPHTKITCEGQLVLADLALLVKRLCVQLRRVSPGNSVAQDALLYLDKWKGNPLRENEE